MVDLDMGPLDFFLGVHVVNGHPYGKVVSAKGAHHVDVFAKAIF